MKIDYSALLLIISLILSILILISVLYGCKYTNYKIEKFENNDSMLDKFEKNLLDGIKNGKVNSDHINDMIKTNKFTKKNLDNMINYIENFKGGKLD